MNAIAGLHPLFHLGSLVSVIAVALRGQLPLRLVLLLSYVLFILDNTLGTQQPEWPYLVWNVLFLVINLYVLIEIVLDRTTFGLTHEEKEVFGTLISLSPGEFRRLSRLADWHVAREPTPITVEGVVPSSLFYVYHGDIEVVKGGRSISVGTGSFIGEIAFLRGTPASASVSLDPGTRYMEWPVEPLRRHLAKHNALRISFNRMLSDDLALKLARS
jgi:hypothetical protein